MQEFLLKHEKKEHNAKMDEARRESSTPILCPIVKCRSDREVWNYIKAIANTETSPEEAIQKVERKLRVHESVNRLLMSTGKPISRASVSTKRTNDVLYKDTPVMCLTYGEIIERRNQDIQRVEIEAHFRGEKKREKETYKAKNKEDDERKSKLRDEKRTVTNTGKEEALQGKAAKKHAQEIVRLEESTKRLCKNSAYETAAAALFSLS